MSRTRFWNIHTHTYGQVRLYNALPPFYDGGINIQDCRLLQSVIGALRVNATGSYLHQ